MPTFGFVLTLESSAQAERTREALAREPDITLGEYAGARLPLVLELDPQTQPEARIERWLALPGVLHVDYAFADFDDLVSDARDEEGPTP